jgi:hypothetical protein
VDPDDGTPLGIVAVQMASYRAARLLRQQLHAAPIGPAVLAVHLDGTGVQAVPRTGGGTALRTRSHPRTHTGERFKAMVAAATDARRAAAAAAAARTTEAPAETAPAKEVGVREHAAFSPCRDD